MSESTIKAEIIYASNRNLRSKFVTDTELAQRNSSKTMDIARISFRITVAENLECIILNAKAVVNIETGEFFVTMPQSTFMTAQGQRSYRPVFFDGSASNALKTSMNEAAAKALDTMCQSEFIDAIDENTGEAYRLRLHNLRQKARKFWAQFRSIAIKITEDKFKTTTQQFQTAVSFGSSVQPTEATAEVDGTLPF